MTDIVLTQQPFRLTVDGSVDDSGEVVADLTPGAISDGLGITATGTALITAASASAARTTIGVEVVSLEASLYVAAGTAGVLYLPVPSFGTGTVTSILAACSTDPGADVAVTPAIGPSAGPFVAITDGDFTVLNTSTVGTAFTATPTAANAVTGGTSIIEIAWAATAVNPFNLGITIEVTRT